MSIVYTHVKLYPTLKVKVGTENGSPVYKEYTEESYHRPLIGSSSSNSITQYLGTPLFDISGVAPKKGREFSEMEVGISYPVLMGLTDKKIPRVMWLTSATADVLIGWIDGFEPVATKGPSENTRILWHIDWWLTAMVFAYQKKLSPGLNRDAVSFGNGTFKRGPQGMARPDPSAPRMWLYDSDTVLRNYSTTLAKRYAIILWTQTFTDSSTPPVSITGICSGYWEVGETYTSGGTTYQAPTVRDIYGGIFEEMLGLPASSIIGVWFSPIAYGDGTSTIKTNDYQRPYSSATYHSFMHTYGYLTPSSTTPVTVTISNTSVCTTDTVKYLVTDPKGTVYATLPWGIGFTACRMTLDVGTTGAWLVLRFLDDPNGNMPLQEGREVQIPLITAPITSNAMSDYVSSGQQDYDRQSAILQQEYNRKSGIANAMQSAGSGAIGGALVGKAPGAIAGALIGGGMGILQTQINYQLGTEFDRKSQQLLDQLTSNQIGSVLTRSGGPM